MRAVTFIIVGMTVVIDKIIAGNKTGICKVGCKRKVLIIFIGNSRVENCYNNIRVACCCIPGRFDIYSSDVLEVLLTPVVGIVGNEVCISVVI